MQNITKSFIKEKKSNLNLKIEKVWEKKIQNNLIDLMHSIEDNKVLNDYLVDIYYSNPMVHTINKSFLTRVNKIKELEPNIYKDLIEFVECFRDEIVEIESLTPTPKNEVAQNKINKKESEISNLNTNLSLSDLKEIDAFLTNYNEPQRLRTTEYLLNIKKEFLSYLNDNKLEQFKEEFGTDIYELGQILRYSSDEKIEKDVTDDFINKRMKLKAQIIKETNKSEIKLKFINAELYTNSNGSFDGDIEFDNLKIYITTVIASGEIQRPHYRTLVKSHDVSLDSSPTIDECLQQIEKEEAAKALLSLKIK